jgi:hypothetical protein
MNAAINRSASPENKAEEDGWNPPSIAIDGPNNNASNQCHNTRLEFEKTGGGDHERLRRICWLVDNSCGRLLDWASTDTIAHQRGTNPFV